MSPLKRAGGWFTRAVPPVLPPGDVHLWRIGVPEPNNLPKPWHGLLTAAEAEHAARKRIPIDACRTLTSRACLRLLLGHYLGVPPRSIALAISAHGKPELASTTPPALRFNVSHSGDWVVLAFARGLHVGVDVECHRELEYDQLVNSFFSAQERAAWSKLPAAEHRAAFFSAWTRKEAYLKALGLGLSKSLDSFSVGFGPTADAGLLWCESDAAASERWRVSPVELAPGYTCAVAVESGATALQTFTFDTLST